MASIRKHYKKYQVLIRRKGHPLICKSFASYSEATKYAQESEANIAKGLYADLSEAIVKHCRDENLYCINMASELDLNYDDFYDQSHLNPIGSKKVSKYLFKKLSTILYKKN